MRGYITRGRLEGTWYLRVEKSRDANGRRRQQRETFRGSKREAETRLRELIRMAENGGLGAARLTFTELAIGTLTKHACDDDCVEHDHEKARLGGWVNATKTRVGYRTWARYRQIVHQYLIPAFGEMRVDKLRPAHIEATLAQWSAKAKIKRTEQPLSPRSVKHLRDTLRAMWRWGVRMELVSRDVISPVQPPKVEQREIRTLDAFGVASLVEAAEGDELQAPIAVAIGTGLRRGELLGLRWTDIDFDAKRLTVRRSIEMVNGERREKPPKTARSARTMALAAFVVAALRQQQRDQIVRLKALHGKDAAEQMQRDAYVFDRADGTPWNPDSFSWSFAQFIKRNKLPKIRLHDLRHSHATIALSAGTDLKTISAALGLSTIAIAANTYVHAIEAMQREHAERIEAAIGAGVGRPRAGGATTVPRGTLSKQERL